MWTQGLGASKAPEIHPHTAPTPPPPRTGSWGRNHPCRGRVGWGRKLQEQDPGGGVSGWEAWAGHV